MTQDHLGDTKIPDDALRRLLRTEPRDVVPRYKELLVDAVLVAAAAHSGEDCHRS